MTAAGDAGGGIVVIPTGVANQASVVTALGREGLDVRIDDRPGAVDAAARVVLPGVGSFGAGAEFLAERGLVQPLVGRVRNGRPLLAICLGMQLLFEESEESPGTHGLGLVPGRVERFAPGRAVPHMGWNRVEPRNGGPAEGGRGVLRAGHAYFANSYRVVTAPDGWEVAWCEYGGPFVAAMQRGAVLACQFHPELSGAYGADLIHRWLEATPC